jgi:hypothetical protein
MDEQKQIFLKQRIINYVVSNHNGGKVGVDFYPEFEKAVKALLDSAIENARNEGKKIVKAEHLRGD